jgi:Nif-specific regulatory protein
LQGVIVHATAPSSRSCERVFVTTERYEFGQELFRTDWHVLHRGRRQQDGKPVLIKAPTSGGLQAAAVESLKREYELLQRVATPGIPRPLELVDQGGSWCLVIEDGGGRPLQDLLPATRGDLRCFFSVAAQISGILAELHRHDIVHRGLHPRSILIHPATNAVSIVDFALASSGSGQGQTPFSARLSLAQLPYMSPEQTGRMNRATDYRSDFYSLGVILYEILTGLCPFRSDDPLEMVHQHIAQYPSPPHTIVREVPEMVSGIVMKLLAKTAEQRYQSALGSRQDIEICAREWSDRGSITPFPLGQHDISDRFLIPQKLYGRERELETLLGAFDRTCEGPAALMAVAGYSGIGKTALIQELYKPLARQRGYFITGKFDQITKVPYGGFVQAFRGFIQQLLTEDEERLASWRARLTEALGANAAVLTEVIPEIELLIGKQPAVSPLRPTEAQNRFRQVVQNFVAAIARKDHPLVVFLDDLQWADLATLNLLQPLLTSPDIRYLFLIGAYRDNEVDATHPLVRALALLEAEGASLHRLALGPLALPHLVIFTHDTLHGDASEVEPLARLILRKTDGNPFFVIQFLKTLRQEQLLTFDYSRGCWTFRLENVDEAGMTDNVIDLMTRKIQRLSPKAQTALTLAACVGNKFDLPTLATVSQQSSEGTAADLEEALNEGLIVSAARRYDGSPLGQPGEGRLDAESFAFLHDRVQQAAYAFIPEERKQLVHLTIGRLIWNQWSPETAEERLFDVIHHLNLGRVLISESTERLDLSRLNLKAGRKAKISTAYQAALGYFRAGIDLLVEDCWETDYELMLALHLEAAECEYLCGLYDEASRSFSRLLGRARTALDKAQVYNLWIRQYENMSRYGDAIRVGKEGLALFGVHFPDAPEEKRAALESGLAAIQTLMGERSIQSLIDLPAMSDAESRMVMKLLNNLHTSCFLSGDRTLTHLNIATMVQLSLAQGNVEESAYAYALHAAMMVGPIMKDYRSAYEFGALALRLNERFPNPAEGAKVLMCFAWAISLWRRPIEESIPVTREAFRLGYATGLFTEAAWSLFNESWFALLSCRNLRSFEQEYAPNVEVSRRIRMHHIADAQQLILQWGRALQGRTVSPLSFTDGNFDEDVWRRNYSGNSLFEMFYFTAKLAVLYTFEDYRAAHETAQRGVAVIGEFTGTIWDALTTFYQALVLCALHSGAGPREREAYETRLEALNARLQLWAENCPNNFGPHHLIVSAEIARWRGKDIEALGFYQAAVQVATSFERIRERALANELCAKFWLDKGQKKVAAVFMTEARDDYALWGAAAKAEDLERRYPEILNRRATSPVSRPADADAERVSTNLDLSTVLKAARAIAVEIEMDDLLRRLMEIALENAGAERGVFLRQKGASLVLEAEGSVEQGISVRQSTAFEAAENLSHAVVRYVHKTGESIVVDDAVKDERFAGDPYIKRKAPKSILCTPIVHQGRLGGILYLENNLATDAFTSERTEMMRVLSATAAISLEKAQLYEEMREEVARRRRAEERERALLDINNAIISNLTQESLLRAIFRALRRVVPFDRCAIFLHDPKKNVLRLIALEASAPSAHFAVGYEVAVDEGNAGWVFRHQKFSLRRDLEKERSYATEDILFSEGIRSLCAVPLIVRTQSIGTLGVVAEIPDQYSKADAEFLQEVANQVALAIENMKSYEEIAGLKARLEAENVYLQEEIRTEHNFSEVVGNSPSLVAVLRKVEQIAPTDSTVLVLGETGTGKELIARAIHDRSARKRRPLVKVNCSAISAGLVESELFGHVKGAFTGAFERRVGRFELADGGTIFLDEIAELPLETQVKLLRVLQEQEFEAVGSSRTVRVNVRIIAATNRDLEEAIKAGRFRSDLFYRLNVFPLYVPPLRERLSDIPQLVAFFLERFSKKFGKSVEAVSRSTMSLLESYAWPGNIRELQNLIERGVVLCQGPVLTLDPSLLPSGDVPPRAVMSAPVAHPMTATGPKGGSSSLEEVERQHIRAVLEQTGGVVEGPKGAAKILNLHPNTLRSRMKKLGIRTKRTNHEMS